MLEREINLDENVVFYRLDLHGYTNCLGRFWGKYCGADMFQKKEEQAALMDEEVKEQ